MAVIEVRPVAAEGRDLDRYTFLDDQDDSEVDADGDRARKQALHLFDARGRRDVVVVGRSSDEEISYAPAGEESLVPGGTQPPNDALGSDPCSDAAATVVSLAASGRRFARLWRRRPCVLYHPWMLARVLASRNFSAVRRACVSSRRVD